MAPETQKTVIALVLVVVVVGGGYLLLRDRSDSGRAETDSRLRDSGLDSAGSNAQRDRDATARTLVALAQTGAQVGGQIAGMAGGKGGSTGSTSGSSAQSPYTPTGKTPTWSDEYKK